MSHKRRRRAAALVVLLVLFLTTCVQETAPLRVELVQMEAK
jgi:hypothetical protein